MHVVAVRIDWVKARSSPINAHWRGLSPQRIARIERLHRFEDRFRALLASLLPYQLWRSSGQSGDYPTVEVTAHGKPYFRDVDGFEFNLSHAGPWVVGVCDAQPVGIDVEAIDRAEPLLAAPPASVFSTREVDALHTVNEADRAAIFIRWWTLKEAAVKARGTGFSTSLYTLEFDLQGRPLPNVGSDASITLDQWCYRWYSLDQEHVLSVCARGSDFPLSVRVLGQDQVLADRDL